MEFGASLLVGILGNREVPLGRREVGGLQLFTQKAAAHAQAPPLDVNNWSQAGEERRLSEPEEREASNQSLHVDRLG